MYDSDSDLAKFLIEKCANVNAGTYDALTPLNNAHYGKIDRNSACKS